MRTLISLMGLGLATTLWADRVNFDAAEPGGVPAGWTVAVTGGGTPRWTVVRDASAPSKPNVLEQSGQAKFALCLKDQPEFRDGSVRVRFKPVAGKEDQAGGVVWRYRDSENYYVCRANALENNVVLYKVENGKRSPLDIVGRKDGYGVKVAVAAGRWHTLGVSFAGTRFQVWFDGRKQFQVEDATFGEAGKVGLWTKADSLTRFDDFIWTARRAVR
ncbi:MAG: family 16 glycoside hydrolase [Verrucomicrobiota bacterium]|jgi:hypothetical protein